MFVLSTKTMNTNTKSATKKSNQNQFLFFFSAAVLSAGDYPLVALAAAKTQNNHRRQQVQRQ